MGTRSFNARCDTHLMENDMALNETSQQSFPMDVMESPLVLLAVVVDSQPLCQLLLTELEALESKFSQVRFLQLNADKAPFIAAQLNVQSVPAMYAWRDGQVLWVKVGMPPAGTVKAELSALMNLQ